jgi:hypothetical protein
VCFTSPPLPKRKKEVIEVMTEVRVVPLQPEKEEAVAAAEKNIFLLLLLLLLLSAK